MKLNKTITYTILLLFALSSCIEKAEWEVNSEKSNLIVAEGLITNQNIRHEIRISQTVLNLNEPPEEISGAVVGVHNGDTLLPFFEDSQNPGVYKPDSSFIGVINTIYTLVINYNNKTYTANAEMIPVVDFIPLTYKYNPEKALNEIVHISSSFSSQNPAMWKIFVDWSSVPGYTELPIEDTQALLYFYTLNTLDVNQIFAPKKEKIFFPSGAKIIEEKYSLSPAHAEYIRSMLSETEWAGGLFDTNKGNVKTNLSEGAVGFFGACSVISDTIIIQ